MSIQNFATKPQIHPSRAKYLLRNSLIERLNKNRNSDCTQALVSASGGFGNKTHLRIYWPEGDILAGKWYIPDVTEV